MAHAFASLTEREILALAISLEEEDGRIYGEFANRLRKDSPSTASDLDKLVHEEAEHRNRLFAIYRDRFGDHLPRIDRSDVRGFTRRKPVWLMRVLTASQVRKTVGIMEFETRRFYDAAARRSTDAGIRQLLGDLAEAEREHIELAESLERDRAASTAPKAESEAQRRAFVLQIVQPGLVGLMDGSVSTLAPLFAAALATRSSHDALLVGLAASVGAGISMGFAEALSDDGTISGRGHPWVRGGVCGLMTTVGGIGHTLPFLIADFHLAMGLAVGVVIVELGVISWIRHHFMDSPIVAAAIQIVIGGLLVFLAGILIGSA